MHIYQNTYIYIYMIIYVNNCKYIDACINKYIYIYGGFPKWGYREIIHFKGIFHYKPSIIGYPHFRNPPYT